VRRARTAARFGRNHGAKALLVLALSKVTRRTLGTTLVPIQKISIIDFYAFTQKHPIGRTLESGTMPRNTVNWVVPPISPNSGGHLNIFRFMYYLEKDGFDCRMIVAGEPVPSTVDQVRTLVEGFRFPLRAAIYVGMETAPPAHVTIATSWPTAYYVRNFAATIHRCYFVQDFEPYFYASGSEYALAEATYRFGFVGITAGTWLKHKLHAEYGMRTEAFSFGFDRDLYRPLPRREPDIRRVFFYARPPTPRRAFESGILVLHEVTRRLPDVKVVFAGWDISNYHIPFEHLNAGALNLAELPDLYSQCDVALVLSFSNVSLLPLEMMACGTPVVSNRAPYTEWLLHEDNARLAEPTVDALADALCAVLENPAERQRLRDGGLRTTAASDWGREAKKVGEILRAIDAEVTVS
jgi:glycosyltransferase involved in cell wall biosynthesis